MSVTESYDLSADDLDADNLAKEFALKSDVGIRYLPEPDLLERSAPIWLGSPIFRRHRCTVRNLKAHFVGPEDNDDVITPYVAFKARWTSTSTEFQVDWFLKTINGQVPAKSIGPYLKSLKKINDNSAWNYNFAYSDAEAN
ncbi:MAG: hypothetical protein EOR45_14535 [Mesorhizobium sp.]|nr:MAG: hypothetical protein EOR45_14535 [Mesorhizobium sp.]